MTQQSFCAPYQGVMNRLKNSLHRLLREIWVFRQLLLDASSPLPGLTPLAPRRDLQSVATAREGGKQPSDNDSHDESGGIGDS